MSHYPFFALRQKYGSEAQNVVDKLRSDLEDILLSHLWYGFGIGILVHDYNEIRNTIQTARRIFRADPAETAYMQIFYQMTHAVQKTNPGYQVEFTIDDSTYSPQIIEAYKALKIIHPELVPNMGTILPRDDKVIPPLQMADLMANIVKDVFVEWLDEGKPEFANLEKKWHSHFAVVGKMDREHLLDTVAETLNDPRYAAGLFPERTSKPNGTTLRRKEKQRRKALIKAAGAKQ
jgi:hypothetical protein